MGACLSCLGGNKESDETERGRLLYDDHYSQPPQNYGSWNASTVPPQNIMSPEEVKREQQAMDAITRWASDQIVEIFPHHQHRAMMASASQFNGYSENHNGNANTSNDSISASAHQDILLSTIPGDRSKRSIRIYPASRPTSKDAQSIRSKPSSSKMNDGLRNRSSRVFVKLNIEP